MQDIVVQQEKTTIRAEKLREILVVIETV